VRRWLAFLILLVFAMVLVGGATRLTESGLSITEWKLVAGTLPPFGEAAWQAAFELYRQSPQYGLLTKAWAWPTSRRSTGGNGAHRELGRFIGLVYVAGFLWFALRRAVSPRLWPGWQPWACSLARRGWSAGSWSPRDWSPE
jgi:cytochrome c oxidase assembly protein subunit 15